jgi:hypothetical protein
VFGNPQKPTGKMDAPEKHPVSGKDVAHQFIPERG